jgi:hypothetical protein
VAFLPILQEAQRIWSDPEYMQTIPKAEVCFECKFMSDISHETTHHYGSNQIARIIDVGWSLYGDGFYFVLVTPGIFKNGKTRFYSYKMRDYQGGDLDMLKQDLLIGYDLSEKDVELVSRRIGWVSWEDLVRTIFKYKGLATGVPFEELLRFYRERMLFPEHVLWR